MSKSRVDTNQPNKVGRRKACKLASFSGLGTRLHVTRESNKLYDKDPENQSTKHSFLPGEQSDPIQVSEQGMVGVRPALGGYFCSKRLRELKLATLLLIKQKMYSLTRFLEMMEIMLLAQDQRTQFGCR